MQILLIPIPKSAKEIIKKAKWYHKTAENSLVNVASNINIEKLIKNIPA